MYCFISGVLASLIGLLLIGNMGIAFKDMGSNYVMPSIAAAVVGGVSLSGGDGNYLCYFGAIFATLTNLLIAMGWGDAGKWLGFGIVLFALLIVYVSNRRTLKKNHSSLLRYLQYRPSCCMVAPNNNENIYMPINFPFSKGG